MTDKENKIYTGLQNIGPEVATLFNDAVEISKMNIDSKPYLLSHLAREIESGLRDSLVPHEKIDQKICESCSQAINRKIGHKDSILKAIGIDEENEFAKKWHKIAKEFPGYAHRRGAWNEPREQESFKDLWLNFIDVLEYLVGNYYSIADRMDLIMQSNDPSQHNLGTIRNLLKHNARYVYFFNNLQGTNWLKPLIKEGYFKAELNPVPVEVEDNPGHFSMPYWQCLSYLEKIAIENYSSPTQDITIAIKKIIEDITSFKLPDGNKAENYRTDYSLFKIICSLPKGEITQFHLNFIREAINSKWHGLIGHDFGILIERVIKEENKELLKYTLEIITDYKIVSDNSYDKFKSIFQDYELKQIFDNYKNNLIQSLKEDFANICLKKIDELVSIDGLAFNLIRIPAIENNEQTAFPEKYEIQIVYALRDCLEQLTASATIGYLEKMVSNENVIFKRIGYHILNVRYREFKKMFWSCSKNLLHEIGIKHELYELVKNNSNSFTGNETEIFIKWIEDVEVTPSEKSPLGSAMYDKRIAYKRKEWLTAFLPTDNKGVNELYKKCNEIHSEEVDHPGYDSWHSSIFGNTSPLSIDELKVLSFDEVIDYYKNFEPIPDDFMGPSKEGLLDALILCIQDSPDKYTAPGKQIFDVPSEFLNSWLRGLNQRWRNGKEFNESSVLQIIYSIIQNSEFWLDILENGAKQWLVSSILSFIEDGVNSRGTEFHIDNSQLVKEILILTFKNDNSEIHDYEELNMTALNSTKGKLYSSMFLYSLWHSRNSGYNDSENGIWDREMQSIATMLLKENSNILFHHTVGKFLSNIAYLDNQWVLDNFNEIYSQTNGEVFSAAIDGYFFYNNQPNKLLFDFFEQKQIFQKCLDENHKIISSDAIKNVINHLLIAYLLDFKNAELNSKAIQYLLSNKTERIYSTLIYFFWDTQHRIPANLKPKIGEIWETIFKDCIQLKSQEIDSMILSGTCKWLNTLEKVETKFFEMIKSSIPFIIQRDRIFLYDALEKHINEAPNYVANILLLLFKKGVTYDISRGKINKMVEYLFQNNEVEIANEICLIHAENGIDFLKELYNKYKKSA